MSARCSETEVLRLARETHAMVREHLRRNSGQGAVDTALAEVGADPGPLDLDAADPYKRVLNLLDTGIPVDAEGWAAIDTIRDAVVRLRADHPRKEPSS